MDITGLKYGVQQLAALTAGRQVGQYYICRSSSRNLLHLVLTSPCVFLVVPGASALRDSAFACSEVQTTQAQDSCGLRAAFVAVIWASSFVVFSPPLATCNCEEGAAALLENQKQSRDRGGWLFLWWEMQHLSCPSISPGRAVESRGWKARSIRCLWQRTARPSISAFDT